MYLEEYYARVCVIITRKYCVSQISNVFSGFQLDVIYFCIGYLHLQDKKRILQIDIIFKGNLIEATYALDESTFLFFLALKQWE